MDESNRDKAATGVVLQALDMHSSLAETRAGEPPGAVFADLINSCESMLAMVKPALLKMQAANRKKDQKDLIAAHQELFLLCDAVAVTSVSLVTHFPGYHDQLLTPEIRAAWQLDTLKN